MKMKKGCFFITIKFFRKKYIVLNGTFRSFIFFFATNIWPPRDFHHLSYSGSNKCLQFEINFSL